MAKVPFSKLDAKVNNDICTTSYCNVKGEEISYEVKKYLPITDKLDLVTNIVNYSVDDNGYYNEGKVRVYFVLEVIDAYTNLSFTEKQQEDPCKLYDLIVGNGLWTAVWDIIPEEEKEYLETCLAKTIKSIYDYKNSILGILDTVTKDYSNMQLDASNIKDALADPNNLSLLRDVLTKLG